jgi:hypothetical protein
MWNQQERQILQVSKVEESTPNAFKKVWEPVQFYLIYLFLFILYPSFIFYPCLSLFVLIHRLFSGDSLKQLHVDWLLTSELVGYYVV